MILVQVKNHTAASRQYEAHKVMYDEGTGRITLVMPAHVIVRIDGHDTYIQEGIVNKRFLISNIEWMSCDYTTEEVR